MNSSINLANAVSNMGKAKCHERCRYGRICYAAGADDQEPFECIDYFHIDDMMADAEDIRKEQMHTIELEEWS